MAFATKEVMDENKTLWETIVAIVTEHTLLGDIIVRIGTLNKDTHTEYGNAILRQKTSMPFQVGQFPIFVSELKATMESGVGTIAGLDPQLKMEYSDNGARSFKIAGVRSYGEIGEYLKIPSWRRQGRIPTNRVLRFTTTEPVKSHFLRLDATASTGQQI